MIHPVYGRMSQCDAHPRYKVLPTRSSPARSLYCAGSNITLPPELLSPVPGYVPVMSTGPPRTSAPLVASRACSRWWYFPELSFDIATAKMTGFPVFGRKITGVEVIPISGDPCPQPRLSDVVSPDVRVVPCHTLVPVSAS